MRGFTLIEALIGISILTISLLGVVAMMVYFGTQTSDTALKNCLLDGAVNALAEYRVDKDNVISATTSIICENKTITISMSHSTYPLADNCNDVTATAICSSPSKSVSLTTKVCNFQ